MLIGLSEVAEIRRTIRRGRKPYSKVMQNLILDVLNIMMVRRSAGQSELYTCIFQSKFENTEMLDHAIKI